MKNILFLLALLTGQMPARSQTSPALAVSAEFVGASTYHCVYGLDGSYVRLAVKNTTTATRSFFVMSCSWMNCWKLNKTIGRLYRHSCDKNVPEEIVLLPGQEVVFYSFVSTNKKATKIDLVDNSKLFQDKEYEVRFAFTEFNESELLARYNSPKREIGRTYWSQPVAVAFPDNSYQIKSLSTK